MKARSNCVYIASGGTACDTVPADARGKLDPRAYLSCRVSMETLMRTLQVEELELVAGGAPASGETPGFTNTQSTKNNGLGNGDQGAPGGSGPNNQAENTAGTGPSALHVINFPHTSGFNMDAANFQWNNNT